MIAFLHPALLAALPLALLPLWLRIRPQLIDPQTVPFAATRLLVAAALPALKHRRHRDWLTTVLRILVLAFIVLGFARPYRVSIPAAAPFGATAGVTILAQPHQFLETALGGREEAGPNRLVFLDERTAGPLSLPPALAGRLPEGPERSRRARRPLGVEDLGVRLTELRTGEVAVATGPYFHPALAGLDDALGDVVVRRWWKLEPVGRTFVIARLSNGDPFLVEHWSPSEPCSPRTIVCASAADLAWTDLPVQPGFVPLVRGLVTYLTTPARALRPSSLHPDDWSRWLCGLAAVLALGELALTGFRLWKLLGLVVLGLVVSHPQWRWRQSPVQPGEVWRVIDETDSMAPRRGALTRALAASPPGPAVTLRGDHTALGDTLLALTNRPVASVVLFSDGQQNAGIHPALAALALGVPVFAVAVGPPDEPAGGPMNQSSPGLFPLRQGYGGQAGGGERRSSPPPEGLGVGPIRVSLDAPAPNWEFLHVRHALQRDPGIALVESNAAADVVLRLEGETWRWQRYGEEVFQRYWSERVRAEYRARHPNDVVPPAVAAPARLERARLWRNDAVLAEIARVSAGRLFTDQTLGDLAAAVRAGGVRTRTGVDLRDWWLVPLAVAGLFMLSWRVRQVA